MVTMHVLSIDKHLADGTPTKKLLDVMVESLFDRIDGDVVWHRVRELPEAWQVFAVATRT